MARDAARKVLPFQRRRRRPPTLKQLLARRRRDGAKLALACLTTFALTVAIGLAWPQLRRELGARVSQTPSWSGQGAGPSVVVTRVIDGDTFDIAGGERVRILNIDAAEMPPKSHCAREADLAVRGKARLQDLVRRGDQITLVGVSRDRDTYGRLLRFVRIDGQDVGDQLIREGLAQPWRGRHAQWC